MVVVSVLVPTCTVCLLRPAARGRAVTVRRRRKRHASVVGLLPVFTICWLRPDARGRVVAYRRRRHVVVVVVVVVVAVVIDVPWL